MTNSFEDSITIRINEEHRALVDPLEEDDYQNLFTSIKEKGLWQSITINREGVLLDGHYRFKICKELDTDIRI